MMMFDNKMSSIDFQMSKNEGITGKAALKTSSDINKDVPRRVSDNSTSSEDSNNMFTKFAFPFKLHSILENSQASGQESIISWLPSGKAFKIHKPKEFADAIMPQYFNQTKYRSFQRQLYIYGFDRIKDKQSDDYGAYFHELFIRGASDLCLDMQRKKIKGTGLSNEERRKKASSMRANNRPSNKNNKQTKMNMQSGNQRLFDTDRLTTNNQSLYTSLGMNNPLADQLQQTVGSIGKLNPTDGWDSASAAAVLKSALQVQEFAVRQDNMNMPNNFSNSNNNMINNNNNGNSMPRINFNEIKKVGGRRCSLGFVRTTSGTGRRGSLLFDGDEVIFGDKKFHFTTKY
jgi:hypothetical protein